MTEKLIKKHWWVAGFMSALSTGMGHFYAGKLRAGLLWLSALVMAPIAIITMFGGWRFGFLTAFAAQGAIWIAAIISAAMASAKAAPLEKSSSPKLWQYFGFYLGSIVFAFGIASLYKEYGTYRVFNIPAGSMKPSLEIGDTIVVRKLSPEKKGNIQPGTVVVFKNGKDTDDLGRPQDYVKRVVAIGGESINFRNGIPVIDGAQLTHANHGIVELESFSGRVEDVLIETESNRGKIYMVADWQPGSGPLDNVGPYNVPKDHYFVLGDNRDQSQDSRVISAVGYIPAENIVGEAIYISWNLKNLSRIGKKLD